MERGDVDSTCVCDTSRRRIGVRNRRPRTSLHPKRATGGEETSFGASIQRAERVPGISGFPRTLTSSGSIPATIVCDRVMLPAARMLVVVGRISKTSRQTQWKRRRPISRCRPSRTALAGRYAFERELGRGGMATVYLARDLTRDKYVAVKVLLPELAVTLGIERFLREIDVGTALQHPRIVGVLDSGQADGVLYYVMPFVDGASLRDRLNREKQLTVEDTIQIAQQVADALAYAHSKGVIHRDIKPENILLDANGAMVADFGIARAVSVAGGETLTRTGMSVGTPTYMSPEQAMGSKDVTPESDIYSLACVVYEMLAGQPPFTGPTAMALLARHSLDNGAEPQDRARHDSGCG